MTEPNLSRRAAGVLLSAAATIFAVVILALVLTGLLKRPEGLVPPAATSAKRTTPLTEQVVLVIVDGLRYDYGTDPKLMPHYARAMRQHAHGELWANRVTMTSAAVYTFGTGKRAGFLQVVANLNAPRTQSNNLIENLRKREKRVTLVGDPVWKQMFGRWDSAYTDKEGLAIHVDTAPEMFRKADEVVAAKNQPTLFVAHFLAPDHQGHAYRTDSDRYLTYIHRFDKRLHQFLQSLPKTSAVLVTSDHGATPTGTHGTDTPRERRSPFFAYGKGIRDGIDLGRVEQIHLAPTLATLMGVPVPYESRGAPLLKLLDTDGETKAKVACAQAERIAAVARAEGELAFAHGASEVSRRCQKQPLGRTSDALNVVAAWDHQDSVRRVRTSMGSAAAASLLTLAMLLAGLWLSGRVFGRVSWATLRTHALPSFAMCALAIFLTYQTERLPGNWPNVVRVALFVACNIFLLVGVVKPKAVAGSFERYPRWLAPFWPVVLVATYPANTQAECFIVVVVGAICLTISMAKDGTLGVWPTFRPPSRFLPLSAMLASLPLLVPLGFRKSEPCPPWARGLPVAAACACVAALCFAWLAPPGGNDGADAPENTLRRRLGLLGICGLLWGLPLGLSQRVSGVIGLPAVAVWAIVGFALVRKRPWIGAAALVGSYLWLLRPVEVGGIMALSMVAMVISHQLRGWVDNKTETFALYRLSLSACLLFGLVYLSRIGVQYGLDFPSMDFGAGQFHDRGVSQIRVGLCMGWKYIALELAILALVLSSLPRAFAQKLSFGWLLLVCVRAGTLAWMLFACRSSYWTVYRCMADLAPALTHVLGAAAALVAISLSDKTPASFIPTAKSKGSGLAAQILSHQPEAADA